jgi:uncharacterized damage-inducible protein DinB
MEITKESSRPLDLGIITPETLLNHWQGHRKLTRQVIEAFPEEQLHAYSIGGMRPFFELAKEIMGLSGTGIRGIVTGNWDFLPEEDYRPGKSTIKTKEELLRVWDKVTNDINTFWWQIPAERFKETIKSFGQWEGETTNIILYWIDNEIHHRGQGYVYLRSLGIEPPPFWNRH